VGVFIPDLREERRGPVHTGQNAKSVLDVGVDVLIGVAVRV
jgi:hypothetical protein